MISGKKAYLDRLTTNKFGSLKIGKNIEGSSPPSIFIGHKTYPKVFAGPMVTGRRGDTGHLDTPEKWMNLNADIVASFRMSLARGMNLVGIKDLDSNVVAQMRDIALSEKSLEANAEFEKAPRGYTFSEHHQPFGPSAPLKSIELENAKYQKNMEKAYYDTDLIAKEAVTTLYDKGLLVSQIQKAFSVGAFGVEKNRRLVPTRWSITAVDDILSKDVLEKVKTYPLIDGYYVYEFSAYNNKFVILLTPRQWQYEFLEAFIHIFGNEEVLFVDWEPYTGRKDYASMGGCYYSTRLAITEHLDRIKKQAGALVFRESYKGYVPLGVWLVRESSRKAFTQPAKVFNDMNTALAYVASRLKLPMARYRKDSTLLKQRTLSSFV